MFVAAVTGGIACGKSLFVDAFVKLAGDAACRFDCDQAVHNLLQESDVVEAVIDRFGNGVADKDDTLNRTYLRERIFSSDSDREDLEAILHPLVLEQAEAAGKAAETGDEPPDYFLFEVPLLYEVDFSLQRDTDVVVASSPEVQKERLKLGRGLNDDVIKGLLEAQLSVEDKVSRGEHVIWNDGMEEELGEEAYLLKSWIDKKAGE